MATTNDSAVVDLGRLKTFKSKLDASMGASSVNAATNPLPSKSNYKKATATGELSCAVGNNSASNGPNSVAIGNSAISTDINGVALGGASASAGDSAVAIGSSSVATDDGTVAIGTNSKARGNGSISIGALANNAETVADDTICIGRGTTVGAGTNKNTVIGADARVNDNVYGSVAIGANSECTETAEFSVGNSTFRRRITNVADPVNPADAATKKYVDGMSGGMHIVAITNVSSVLTSSQLSEIDQYWPNVIIYVRNNNTIFSPVSKINPSNVTKYFTFIHVEDTHNSDNGVSNGGGNILEMVQIVVNATDGSIIITTDLSLSPIIATNPSLSSGSQKKIKAIGNNSIAAGNNSSAMSDYAIALGFNSLATGTGAIAIGAGANAEHLGGIALGNSSATDKDSQVSIGDKASGVTRYLSNVKDPVEDQDAATRYWTKNADRSDVFASNTSINTYGGSGMFDLEANRDLKWVSVSGYTSWSTFGTAWSKMVNLPGGNANEWWIKTDLKVPDAMKPSSSFVSSHPCGLEFFSTYTMPARTFSILVAVGSDGYIYIGKWTSKPSYGDEPYGIYLDGHRFYM